MAKISVSMAAVAAALYAGAFAQTRAGGAADEDDIAALRLSFETAWDDNLIRLDEGEAVPEGRSKDDTFYTATLQLDLSQDVSLQEVFLRGTIGYLWHEENEFLDRERINLAGGINWQVTPRCGGVASAQIFRGQSDLNDLGDVVENLRQTVIGRVTAGCRVGLALYPEVAYQHRSTDNSESVRERNDLREDQVSLSLRYQRTPRASIAARYTHEELSYPNRFDAVGDEISIDVDTVALDATRRIGDDIDLRASLAYAMTDSSVDGSEDFEGVTGNLAVRWSPSRRTSFTTAFERTVDAQADIGSDFFVRERTSVEGQYRLTQKTALRGRYSFEEREFRGVAAVDEAGRSVEDLKIAEAAITYDPIDPVRITLGVRDVNRDADTAFADFEATRVFISLGAVY